MKPEDWGSSDRQSFHCRVQRTDFPWEGLSHELGLVRQSETRQLKELLVRMLLSPIGELLPNEPCIVLLRDGSEDEQIV